jgi:hypothetical protein
MASLLRTGILCLLLTVPSMAQEANDKPPDLDAIAKAGQASLKRLERQAAAWKAITPLPDGTRAIVEMLVTPRMRRSVLFIEARGQRLEAFRIIDRDGCWYATEGSKAGRYRPYEAPFDLPTAYFFLVRSNAYFLTQPREMELAVFEGTESGIATYRMPLPETLRRQLFNTLDGLEALRRQRPNEAAQPELARSLDQVQDLLKKGTPLKIDIATGMFVQLGNPGKQMEFHDFAWLDDVPAREFEVGNKAWDDNTADPTIGDRSELLMISHNGIWHPGMKAGDTDGRLLDLRSGRYRRIPFQGAIAMPGCFLKDRTKVVVSGVDGIEGALRLYEVDLKTGQNRRLGGELLANGMSLLPALSPDGKMLAVLHKGATEAILDSQVCLVDLASGEARTLGEPHDMAFLSWFPDGRSLLLLKREVTDPADVTSERQETIARLDLNGRMTKIRDGGNPILLRDGRTILFRDTRQDTWQICDLDGGTSRVLAGGLAQYGFPSLAPDGKRIVMMRFRPGHAPEPQILNIGESDGKTAVNAPGLWATPAWQ